MNMNVNVSYKNGVSLVGMDGNILPLSKKKRVISLYLPVEEFFDLVYIQGRLSDLCKPLIRYTIITKVCFVKNKSLDEDVDKGEYIDIDISGHDVTDWKSLGDQIYFSYRDEGDCFNMFLKNYLDSIRKRLRSCMERYDYKNLDVQGFQILIYKLDYTDIVVPKRNIKLNTLGEHKDMINVSKISKSFSSLPINIYKDMYGKLLTKVVVDDLVDYIFLLNGDKINFLDRINNFTNSEGKLPKFSSKIDFYQTPENNIVVVDRGNLCEGEGEGVVNIVDVYDINGIKIHRMVDKQIGDDSFSRKIGNVVAYIKNGDVYKKHVKIKFACVYPNKTTGYFSKLVYSDNRIGTLDLETYCDKYGYSKTYALGFYVKDDIHTYYIKKNLDSDSLIMECLDAMLTSKYNNYTFYVHKFATYDVYFILKVIVNISELNPTIYKYKILPREGDRAIISINISKKVGKKVYNIKIVDSYNFLASKLSKLCVTFNSETQKGYFPYKFVNSKTLFYKGAKPKISFYDDLKIDIYKTIKNKDWSTRDETIKYLEKDLIGLYEVMNTFKLRIYSKYHIHITRNLTISGLAMNIFLKRFYNNNIPLINKRSVYNDIKESYFGGITEVYKPYGKNLYYYDVNSLYPYAALNPMPGLDCSYIDNISCNINEYKDKMFGFYYCKIQTSKDYIGLLPYRTDEGILMPVGEFEGWYFSEELKYAYEKGYNIEVLKGYKFDKSLNVFNDYVYEFYNIKSNTTDSVERSISKSLLNNLLGRFGMSLDKSVTELVTRDRFNEILQTRNKISDIEIGDKILLTHRSKISREICDLHDVDFNETFNNEMKSNNKSVYNLDRLHDISVAIASAVTSYSRIYMNKVKLEILSKKGSIYYSDTDSIVTDIELDGNLVGNELGAFKLEDRLKEGYFISNKNYCFVNFNKKVVTVRSGVNSKYLKYEDFVKLYKGEDVGIKIKGQNKNYTGGYVNIGVEDNINLSADSYNKRIKIYKKGLWIDTKPVELTVDN